MNSAEIDTGGGRGAMLFFSQVFIDPDKEKNNHPVRLCAGHRRDVLHVSSLKHLVDWEWTVSRLDCHNNDAEPSTKARSSHFGTAQPFQ